MVAVQWLEHLYSVQVLSQPQVTVVLLRYHSQHGTFLLNNEVLLNVIILVLC